MPSTEPRVVACSKLGAIDSGSEMEIEEEDKEGSVLHVVASKNLQPGINSTIFLNIGAAISHSGRAAFCLWHIRLTGRL